MRTLLILSLLGGCSGKRSVLRDAQTYQTETMAALARQEEAATELFRAADAAKSVGDVAECQRLVAPALLIEAYARRQAYRALWLADLPYPGAPATGDGDPGPSSPPQPAAAYCTEG